MNSQLSFKENDKNEYKRADGRARAKPKIRVYVSIRAKQCEWKGRRKYGHVNETTLTHTDT